MVFLFSVRVRRKAPSDSPQRESAMDNQFISSTFVTHDSAITTLIVGWMETICYLCRLNSKAKIFCKLSKNKGK